MPLENAKWILTTGYDRNITSGESYTTNLPLARAIEADVLLVHTWEGEPLPRDHDGPCPMITPKLYAWKGAKWIRKIEFLDRNRRILRGARILRHRRAAVRGPIHGWMSV